ncbi:MBL fold metallo-hydrolase [Legionella sp. km772]|uniref:MBL fold metallo-hydrolase n=1 Tax=Legionella sp. km772 TaxID=2498111 RepID=UPI000F8E1919|nr:MBL fold metallo-hydrolase [Legionella sp. km772]RUR11154.1 MBL fold metallo-hydrolase [Legionella sp. km772]
MINYQLLEAGFCTHCQRMTLKTGQFKQKEYPALCALIKHPTQGYILFDSGYSPRFYQETSHFPASLYSYLTPVYLRKTLKEQLLEQSILPEDIAYIVISHFHADHIGGLADFPKAQFICHPQAIADIKGKTGFKALLQGFLPGLLPDDFYDRLQFTQQESPLPSQLAPFSQGFDLFDDQSLYAIALPGHAAGQIGLYFEAEKPTFLIADSCWHQESYQDLNYPSQLTYLIHHDRQAYLATIGNLHQLYKNNPQLDIIPSHCQQIRERLKKEELC